VLTAATMVLRDDVDSILEVLDEACQILRDPLREPGSSHDRITA
jgi:hypothetical protein